jgi:hypothetical protein
MFRLGWLPGYSTFYLVLSGGFFVSYLPLLLSLSRVNSPGEGFDYRCWQNDTHIRLICPLVSSGLQPQSTVSHFWQPYFRLVGFALREFYYLLVHLLRRLARGRECASSSLPLMTPLLGLMSNLYPGGHAVNPIAGRVDFHHQGI